MFGFFKKKEPPGRKELRQEFAQVTSALRRADDLAQVAVGHSINMANSMFIQRFKSIDAFRQLPKAERLNYIQSLTAFEERMSQQDPHTAIGFGLFKMWVGVVSENDDELVSEFSKALGYFSRKGDLPI